MRQVKLSKKKATKESDIYRKANSEDPARGISFSLRNSEIELIRSQARLKANGNKSKFVVDAVTSYIQTSESNFDSDSKSMSVDSESEYDPYSDMILFEQYLNPLKAAKIFVAWIDGKETIDVSMFESDEEKDFAKSLIFRARNSPELADLLDAYWRLFREEYYFFHQNLSSRVESADECSLIYVNILWFPLNILVDWFNKKFRNGNQDLSIRSVTCRKLYEVVRRIHISETQRYLMRNTKFAFAVMICELDGLFLKKCDWGFPEEGFVSQ